MGRSRRSSLRPRGGVWTDDELLALDVDGHKHELWSGRIITMSPAGADHGDISSRLIGALIAFTQENKLGRVYDGQTGFRLGPSHCFAPDVSFVSKARLKLILPARDKLFHAAPDLAVEVLSPSDSITKTEVKITLYLMHGAHLVWMVDVRQRFVRVYREPGKFELLRPGRSLSGNSVLPGFRYAVSRLFEDPAFE